MIKVLINCPSWHIGKNTDIDLQRKMTCLEHSFTDISLVYPQSKLLSLAPNILKVISFLKRKCGLIKAKSESKVGWSLRVQPLYNEMEMLSSEFDIIYSQGILPQRSLGRPLLLDLYVMKPEDVYVNPSKQAEERFNALMTQVEKLAQYPGIYNLRSDYAIGLVKDRVKDNAWKFRNLPFLLPQLTPLSVEEITRKHENTETLELLFCGAQSVRKGLPLLLEAFLNAKHKTQKRCRLHIISSMSDGKVTIPDDDDIVLHGEMSHDDTMALFRQSHIYIMPSHFESFGLTYLEAMANGMIVIARDFEPQREILDYGECGFLTPIDVKSLTDIITDVITMDDDCRTVMALKAVDRFKKKYSYEVVSEQWRKAIIDCASQNNNR